MSLGGLRILLLGEPSGPVSIAPWLRGGGAAVRSAASAEDARRALDDWRPDLLLVQLVAPADETYALLRGIRAMTGERAAIPAIAIAAHPGDDERVRAIRSGFSSYVAKLGSEDELAALVVALARQGPESFLPGPMPTDGRGEATASRRIRALDVVVPFFNEEQGALEFHRELVRALDKLAPAVTIYYVDDGSTDGTAAALASAAAGDDRVVVIELSRNFGHQAALSAGLDRARGDAVITLDGDGQHPPELIPAMLELLENGTDVVLGQRADHRQPSVVKRWASSAFYAVLGRLSATKIQPGCADFRAMSRPVVDAIRQMPERHRFVRGMVAWLGFRSAVVPYAERPRREGGSKYSVAKMLRLASDAISSFSLVPLYVSLGLGMLFLLLALLEVAYVLSFWVRGAEHRLAPGWASLMFAILIVGGFAMVAIGIIGSYVGYIFQEVKRRPIYVVRSVRGSRVGEPREPG